MMIFATAIIGLMPTGLHLYFYFFVFFILRTLQTMSFSLDMPATSIYAFRHDNYKITNISKTVLSASIGYVIALSFIMCIYYVFTQVQIKQFAWRIPFIFSTFIGIIVLRSRNNLMIQNNEIESNSDNVRYGFKKIIILFIITIPAVFLVDMNARLPFYLNQFFAMSSQKVQYMQFFASLFSIITCYAFNQILKITNNVKKIYLFWIMLLSIFLILSKTMLLYSSIIFMILWQILQTIGVICALYLTISELPTQNQTLLTCIIYNGCFLICSLMHICYKLY